MPQEPALPPPVADLLAAAFPGRPVSGLAPTFGGFSNLTLRARLGGERCVLKAAGAPDRRAALAREALVLDALRGRRTGAPRPLAFLEGGGWSVLVTAWRPGTPGLRLYARPAAALDGPLRALGRTLARLHRLQLPLPAGGAAAQLLIAPRAAALADALAGLPLPADLAGPLRRALAHPAWRPERPRLVHGDAGLHNVLWGRGRLSLLDWELAGWGDPRQDLAWAAWTLRFRGLPQGAWAALLDGYGPGAGALGLDAEAALALAIGQVAALLARAAGGPSWDEWLRRARWSVGLRALWA